MSRFRRSSPLATFTSHGNLRLMSAVLMLAVVWMLYTRSSDPKTWAWLAPVDDSSEVQLTSSPGGKLPVDMSQAEMEETIVPTTGPDDPDEKEAAREDFQAVADRAPIDTVEMNSYWRLMRWSRGQSFAELEQSAHRNIMFTQLWEEPDKYRGELIRLRLSVVRTLAWDAKENVAGVKQVYEAWGTTPESRSFPYVVVFSELPPQMPLGHDISEEAVFVGYFLKNMSYQDYKVTRGAPLLVGRLKWIPNESRIALQSQGDEYFVPTAIGGGLLVIAIVFSWVWKSRRRPGTLAVAAAPEMTGTPWWEQADEEDSPASNDKFGSAAPRNGLG